ncbi:MAG: hypothetical protein JWN68_1718 [Nocardioides sp.]|jgi:hypothetical protein|uniref:hypothetical protein n=1 Tax=Nocardioides sp. TaxID=35761 RepID=UPI00260C16A9|nr:hypothetical protein [Nocardioides sp.]MCW2833765.1 hypothetical protein [Nocardioides sp.]
MTSWRTWSRSQVGCRVLVALLPVLAVLVAPVRLNASVLVLAFALSLLWAAWPELSAGPVVLLLVMGWWALVVPDPVQPRVLVAAGLVHTAHVGALLAAYAPARAAIHPRLVRIRVRRGALSFLAAPVAYLAVASLDGVPDQPLMWPVAVALLVVASLTIGLRFRD